MGETREARTGPSGQPTAETDGSPRCGSRPTRRRRDHGAQQFRIGRQTRKQFAERVVSKNRVETMRWRYTARAEVGDHALAEQAHEIKALRRVASASPTATPRGEEPAIDLGGRVAAEPRSMSNAPPPAARASPKTTSPAP